MDGGVGVNAQQSGELEMLGRFVPSLSLPCPKIKNYPTLIVHLKISATCGEQKQGRSAPQNG
jgi:hypothetical protein